MQTVLTYLSFLITSMLLHGQNTIEVTMTHFDSNEGIVKVGLYNAEGTFLERPYKALSAEISEEKATVIFSEVPDGIYAISCYHDEDRSGSLNMFMGMIPTESYGTSNNAPSRFGPPKWEDASFEVTGGVVRKLEIKL
ncbi:DUF2141 domain-containing protein [Altibacter sp.]|uniref:DUF2141 domain-containing protein n=1 Tax=Altibacter sp. TaxID=2024823 RepID=UPI0025BC5F0D|nr:DUF2141 domain-containing protein [Altibacter sp.]|tara:strand:- start:476 stop:889 length:414 start_codon:yes stop_codon:yes gene_type:complete